MITRARVGAKFLFVGLIAGLLLAPRSGQETRIRVQRRLVEMASELLDLDLRR